MRKYGEMDLPWNEPLFHSVFEVENLDNRFVLEIISVYLVIPFPHYVAVQC